MSSSEIDRKIAVIFVADVVGYSKHMEKDENATFKAYGECETILNKLLKKYKGSIFNTAGDSVLAEFPSAVNAVECAVDFQNDLKKRNESEKTEVKLEFRIGINMGDVVMKSGNLLGDGVNIAARLEALAQPNGISISKSVYDLVVPKTKVTFNDLGIQKVKQNTFHAYDILLDPSHKRKIKSQSSFNLPMVAGIAAAIVILLGGIFYFNKNTQVTENIVVEDMKAYKPIILVKEFNILGENNSDNSIGIGLAESMIATLTQFNGIKVLSRSTSTHVSQNKLTDREIRDLYNIDYTIEGSIQKIGDKARITASLNDLKKENIVWSEKTNFDFVNIFDIQDDFSNKILSELQVNTFLGEGKTSLSKYFPSFELYTKYLNVHTLWTEFNPESNTKAWKILEDLEKEIPNNTQVNYVKVNLIMQTIWLGLSNDPKVDEQKMITLSNENLKNRGNFDDYANKSIVELWHGSKDCKLVVDLMDKSLDLGKHRWNLYPASAVYSHCGEYDKALSSARLGLELLPNDPRWAITSSLVSTLFKMSKFKEVVEALEKNINAPDVGGLILGVYTASQIELGNMNKAKKMFSRIQKNGRLKKSIIKTRMFPKGDTADRLIDSLEKIGPIPD